MHNQPPIANFSASEFRTVSFRDDARIHPVVALILLIGILTLQLPTLLAGPISGFELGPGQVVRIRTPWVQGSHFIPLRGGDLATIQEPAALGMDPSKSHPDEVELVDRPSTLPIAARFDRVE